MGWAHGYYDMKTAAALVHRSPNNNQRGPIGRVLLWVAIGSVVVFVGAIVMANIAPSSGEIADEREQTLQARERAQVAASQFVEDAERAGLEVTSQYSRAFFRDGERSLEASVVIDTGAYPLHIAWIEPVEDSPVASGQEHTSLGERPDGQPQATIPCGPTGYVVDPHLDAVADSEERRRLESVDFETDVILATATALAGVLDCPAHMPSLDDR